LAYTITKEGFDIHGASISSFGERVVDVFFIQYQGQLLNAKQLTLLNAKLKNIATLAEVTKA